MAQSPNFFRKPAPAREPPRGHELKLRCVECAEPASFGEGSCLHRGIEGTWWCSDHAPERLRHPSRSLPQIENSP